MAHGPIPDRRSRARNRVPQTIRVRPSAFDDELDDFDEIVPTLNVSRDSVFFAAQRGAYDLGTRLLVTFPYSSAPGALNRDFIGRVVRIEELPNGQRGIAVKLLMPVYLGIEDTVRRPSGEWY